MEQIRETAEGGNIVRKIQTPIPHSKKMTKKEFHLSDLVLAKYNGLTIELCALKVREIQMRQKQLDQNLSLIKRMGASLLAIKTRHEFLLFVCDNVLISVDFYRDNKLKVKVGDEITVLTEGGEKRRKSKICLENQLLEWRMPISEGMLTVGDVLTYIQKMVVPSEHSEIHFNGGQFSKLLWVQFNRLSKPKSLIYE